MANSGETLWERAQGTDLILISQWVTARNFRRSHGFTGRAGYCRLAPLFLSNTASIGPSGTMLSLRLSDGAYKFEALPPSRNRALGQFSPSRNRRAKASNDTSP